MEALAQGQLLVEVRNGIAHVTLNRPQALNALTRDMLAALGERLAAWAKDASVHAVLVRGAGEKALLLPTGIVRVWFVSFLKPKYAV